MSSRISEAQLRSIYEATVDALYGYASRKCGGELELAEDVTQEVWLRAVREWPRTGAPDNPLAWLTTVARNLIINHYRKKEGVSLDSVAPEEILAAVEDDRASEFTRRMNQHLNEHTSPQVPSPEFRASLEREVVRAFRRQTQFSVPPSVTRRARLRPWQRC